MSQPAGIAPAPPADPVAWPLAVALLDTARSALAGSLDGPPARVGIVAGEAVALDDCCAGQLWVRIGDITPAAGTGVEVAWTVHLEVGVLRCAPTVSPHGTPPSPTDEQAAAAAVADDGARLRRAVRCAFGADQDSVIGVWRPIGPQGGCVGGLIRLTVTAFDCDCEEG